MSGGVILFFIFYFLLITVIFFASTLLLSGICSVLAWPGPFHLAPFSEKQPGLLSQWYHLQLWLSPRALFTYSATVCDSADNYLLAMAGCITCCVQCTIRLGTFLKILVQSPKAALWLGRCFGLCNALGLGLHQNRFSQWSVLISQQIREWLSSDRFKNRLDHHLPLMLLT